MPSLEQLITSALFKHGTMEIVNHSSKIKATINFKPYSWSSKELHKVEGYITDSQWVWWWSSGTCVLCSLSCSSKRKVRGLYGHWTDSLYSIDIDQFDAFLKQQKKEAKQAAKNPQVAATSASASADSVDHDEDLPDVDPSHEQMNLPPNSITLWRIIPKLDYAAQVGTGEIALALPKNRHWTRTSFSSTTTSLCSPWDWTNGRKRTRKRDLPYHRLIRDFAPIFARWKRAILAWLATKRIGWKRNNVRRDRWWRNAEMSGNRGKLSFSPDTFISIDSRWFRLVKHDVTGQDIWVSNEKYWQRNWSNCPDIY